MIDSKPVEFRGSALDDLRAFPEAARREAGHQLDQIQRGREPDDWKSMNTVGRGCEKFEFVIPQELSECFMWRVRRAGLRAALFPEEDTENQQGRSKPRRTT